MSIERLFFRQVDTASLAVFRIMLGAMLLFEAVNYGVFLCLDCMFRDTEMLFKYQYFEWATLPPAPWFRLSYAVMGIAAIGVMLGAYYRLSIIVLTLIFTWHFLLDQALYLNHFYLVILFCLIMCFTPANRLWSIDARRKPQIRSETIPNWSRFWLGAQLEIVLIYAGLVKLNHDWLNLEPMRQWMNELSQDEATLFQLLTQDWGIVAASYGAIALHLIGAPLLLWKRTRLVVFFVYAFFHLTNAFVFNIGIFPFMTMAATLLLFDPDWPRQVLRWWQDRRSSATAHRWEALARPAQRPVTSKPATGKRKLLSGLLVMGICAWLLMQIAIPLRPYAAPGNVAWNEDGHRFSWRMKLRSKRGVARFTVIKADGSRLVINPASHLNRKQVRTMICIPDLIWQYAQYLESIHGQAGGDVQVYAKAECSLNDRERASLVNEKIDLTAIPRNEPVSNWINPLTTPLKNPIF